MTKKTVEVTTRFVTTVDTLPEAWAFVMDRFERPSVGPNPSIEIRPITIIGVQELGGDVHDWPRVFEVVVEGMVEEAW